QAGAGAAGIPGALTNQPPDGAVIVGGEGIAATSNAVSGGSSRSATRNYEVDRRISHIRETPGAIKRLSVAVVVDDRRTTNESGETVMVPRTEEEMAHLTALVREAVGFDESRGDRVNVVNAPFRTIESADDTAITARPLWEEPWIQELARQALAGVGLLLVILLVLRPAVKPLIKPQLPHAPAALGPPALAVVGDDEEEAQD